jgi:hypothetical protein
MTPAPPLPASASDTDESEAFKSASFLRPLDTPRNFAEPRAQTLN